MLGYKCLRGVELGRRLQLIAVDCGNHGGGAKRRHAMLRTADLGGPRSLLVCCRLRRFHTLGFVFGGLPKLDLPAAGAKQ